MPLSMILFGGLKGELLRHIVKMTVWIADTHPVQCVVWGIGFTFNCLVDCQSSLVLGHSRDGGEYDFPIYGRGGERICRMESITQYSWACDLGFRVRPNLLLGACPGSYAFDYRFANSPLFCKRFIQLAAGPSNSRRTAPGCVFVKTQSASLSL